MKKPLAQDQLLIPRWICIADYPGCMYIVSKLDSKDGSIKKLGDVILEEAYGKALEIENGPTSSHVIDHNPHREQIYPAIFKRLGWWQCRSPKELPHYVKLRRYPATRDLASCPVVFKVASSPFPEDKGAPMFGEKTIEIINGKPGSGSRIVDANDYVPASEEEWLQSLPKFLLRPSDNEIFIEVKKGFYSVERSLKDFPKSVHHQYPFIQLIELGFTPVI